jgi:hypothetical protein
MKTIKPFVLLFLGFIVVFLTGCFQAVSISPNGQDAIIPAPDIQPFTMDIYIGPPEEQARTIAGPSIADIKNGLYNFIQLVVLDETGSIAAFAEKRRIDSAEKDAIIMINSIPLGKKYYFLLLMGYWERDYDNDAVSNSITTFSYAEGVKPVLLASGYQQEYIEGNKIVTITMWPLAVDTKFTAGQVVIESKTGEAAGLLPGPGYNVNWNIRRNEAGFDGLKSLLDAQNALSSFQSSLLAVTNKKFIVDGVDVPSAERAAINNLAYPLGSYGLSDIGSFHRANFSMDYTPFNLTRPESWRNYDDQSFFDLTMTAPLWTIRNGLNDLPQNANTNFDPRFLGQIAEGNSRYNGNGAIVAEIKENKGFTDDDEDGFPDEADDDDGDGYPDGPGNADTNDFIIYDGKFLGPAWNTEPVIAFKTAGYEGEVTVYYGVAEADVYNAQDPLPYSEFTRSFTTFRAAGGPYWETVTLPDAQTEYDIWLVFMKDGKVSNRIAINTAAANIDIEWIWGQDKEKGGLIIYNMSSSQSITVLRVTDSGGHEVSLEDIARSSSAGFWSPSQQPGIVLPIEPQSARGILLEPGTYTFEIQYPAGITPQTKVMTINAGDILSWYVSNEPIVLPFGVLQIVNLSGESVTSVMAGDRELLLASIADTGVYTAPLQPGTYMVKAKTAGQSVYFPEETVLITAGDVTNMVIFNDRVVVNPPVTIGENNNIWILNKCPSYSITKAEKKTGVGAYSSFLTANMPINTGGYAGAVLETGTYDFRVTLNGDVSVVESSVPIAGDPVFLVVQIGSNNQPEIVVIASSGDADGDGFPDWWEREYFGPGAVTDPNSPGKDADADGDGLTNWDEYLRGTDPTKKDSDGDGLTDWEEINGRRDPTIPGRPSNFPSEFPFGPTDPLKVDTDGDQYSDYIEIEEGTDPTDASKKPGSITIVVPWGS